MFRRWTGSEILFVSQIARFVSLMPYMEDSSLAKRRSDAWCTSSEFLHLSAGDSEEHAHLLAGYFLEIGQQVMHGEGELYHVEL